jgi:hypothetical protein
LVYCRRFHHFLFRLQDECYRMAYLDGIIMVANGLQHIVGSIYLRRLMPCVFSAPLLLRCSSYLLFGVPERDSEKHLTSV